MKQEGLCLLVVLFFVARSIKTTQISVEFYARFSNPLLQSYDVEPSLGGKYCWNMSNLLSFFVFLAFLAQTFALYGPKSDVISATAESFNKEVLKDSGIVIVEFYAPW